MRFRFTIRDLLWLTLVVALIAGWRVDRRATQAEIYRLQHPYVGVLQIMPDGSPAPAVWPSQDGSNGKPDSDMFR